MTLPVGILGTGLFAPEQVRHNEEIEDHLGLDHGWIAHKVGVRERRVLAEHEATSDMAVEAAARALDSARTRPEDIELIVVATATPDLPVSSTACLVQGRIGAEGAGAVDLHAACAGFAYGLLMAAALISVRGNGSRALVIGSESMSRILDQDDRATCVLFGDAAGAAVIGRVEEPYGILGSDLGADGTAWDLVHIPGGGSREPASEETVAERRHLIRMNGRGTAQFFAERVPAALERLAEASGLALDEIDVLVPHQANGTLLRPCLAGCGFGDDRVHYTVDRFGNTGSASVAVTLADADAAGRLGDGDKVMVFGIGAGMTWGGLVLRWGGA